MNAPVDLVRAALEQAWAADCQSDIHLARQVVELRERVAELEVENVELRLHLHVAEELLAALREQGVRVPVLPVRTAVVRPLRVLGGGS